MNKSLISGLVIGAVVVTTGVAVAGYTMNREPRYAQVVEVQPVQRTISTPRQVCHDETDNKQRCETVYDTHIERQGYDVRYRIGEQEGKVRMDHDPGERIPLRHGQLVLDARTGKG